MAPEFAETKIRPYAAQWDEQRDLEPGIFGKLAELGFLGMRIPERYGGLDLDLGTYLLVIEELGWEDASLALAVAIHNGPVTSLILEHGTDEQKDAHLPALASGSILGAFALSEAMSGSDAASVQTRAVRTGDGDWMLDGSKRWVTNGDRAGLTIVFASTDPKAVGALGVFLVDGGSEGYSVGEREATMGLRASQTVSVSLNEVRVGVDQALGDTARGLRHALGALNVGRLGVAAQALGIAQAAFEHATLYALERKQFGKAIADFGAIQFKLADMATRITAARSLIHTAAARMEAADAGVGDRPTDGSRVPALAAMAKLTARESAMWVTDEAVQAFGGYGYIRDCPVERLDAGRQGHRNL